MKMINIAPKGAWKGFCLKFGTLLLTMLFVTAITGDLFAQNTAIPVPQFTADKMRQDLTILKDSLVLLHPSFYRYKTKRQMDRLFHRVNRKLSQPMTLNSFYTLTRYIISQVGDGHTSAFLPADLTQKMLHTARFFPVWLHFIGDKAYATGAIGRIPAGADIIAVNHQKISALRKKFFQYIPSDGNDQSVKYAEMNAGESPFFYLYYLLYGEKSSYQVSFIRPDRTRGDTVLNACAFKDLAGRPRPPKIDQYLKLSYTPDSIAVLSVKTFLNDYLKKTSERFDTFMQSAFRELADKHIKKLIIDVRDNKGGHDLNGIILDSYLTDHPFRYVKLMRSTAKVFTDDIDLQLHQPAADHFQGKTFILMNGKSFSTTADFCAVAQNISDAKFIGEESGGGYYGTTSGARTTIYLPNTQIRVNIPLWESINAVKPVKFKDRGVMPDYTVVPSIGDVLENNDVQLDFALKMARQ